jgi:hypothetical protein
MSTSTEEEGVLDDTLVGLGESGITVELPDSLAPFEAPAGSSDEAVGMSEEASVPVVGLEGLPAFPHPVMAIVSNAVKRRTAVNFLIGDINPLPF